VLGSDGLVPVAATGPTFWFGGTVTDPTSLFGQAFYELQFYPDSIVTNCNPNGAFVVDAGLRRPLRPRQHVLRHRDPAVR
jgi:hypothetical protein